MESLSRPPHRTKHSTTTNIFSSSFSFKNPYDDVLLSNGGERKSLEVHEYSEIFSGSSSIPVLDLSFLDERVASSDLRNSKLDYSNIFSGLRNDDVFVPYEELLNGSAKKTKPRWVSLLSFSQKIMNFNVKLGTYCILFVTGIFHPCCYVNVLSMGLDGLLLAYAVCLLIYFFSNKPWPFFSCSCLCSEKLILLQLFMNLSQSFLFLERNYYCLVDCMFICGKKMPKFLFYVAFCSLPVMGSINIWLQELTTKVYSWFWKSIWLAAVYLNSMKVLLFGRVKCCS